MKVELEFKDENLRDIELLTNQKINDWRLNIAVDVAKIFDKQIALMEYLIDQLQTLKTQ